MTELNAQQHHEKSRTEKRNVTVDYRGKLDSGELLTGTPTVSATPAGLTLSSPQINTATLTVNEESVAAGQAVQFKASGGAVGTRYTITVKCDTTGDQEDLEARCTLDLV